MKHVTQVILGFAVWASLPVAAATVIQTAQFDGVSPKRLYDAYLSSEEHSAFTGVPAKIEKREGGNFEAFIGVPSKGQIGITGTILSLDAGTHSPDLYQIVQTWRGYHDNPAELDSTLVLTFRKNEKGTEIELVQANVPDRLQSLVNTHWNLVYWGPLKKYLQSTVNSRN